MSKPSTPTLEEIREWVEERLERERQMDAGIPDKNSVGAGMAWGSANTLQDLLNFMDGRDE